MTTKYSSLDSLQEAIQQEAQKWYSVGLEKFPQERFPLEVRFDLRGKTAGLAYSEGICRDPDNRHQVLSGKHSLKFNPALAWHNQEDFLENTVPHEVAHVIADKFFRKIAPRGADHSDLWKLVMLEFGRTPTRCHDYNVDVEVPPDEL